MAVLKSIKHVRRKIDDVLLINRIESYSNSIRIDMNKKIFLREVSIM